MHVTYFFWNIVTQVLWRPPGRGHTARGHTARPSDSDGSLGQSQQESSKALNAAQRRPAGSESPVMGSIV